MQLKLFYAASDFAAHYDETALSPADQSRHRHANWRVSRALKAHAPSEYGVLSHRLEHAAWLIPTDEAVFRQPEKGKMVKMGVDLEKNLPRDFRAWHTWILSPDEQIWLAQRFDNLADYYALWTLKEALIKAEKGEWADLARVGLQYEAGQWRLRGQNGGAWAGQVWRWQDWTMAAVWSASCAVNDIILQGLGDWQTVKVDTYLRFQAA